jgi:hypothetical protein
MQLGFRVHEGTCGALFLDADKVRGFTRLSPSYISIAGRSGAARRPVERLIEDTYRRSYGSKIFEHYPNLMSVHDADERVLAAVGFRAASEAPLFLEQYLDDPIEAALSAATADEIRRDEIIEIGNLASAGRGASVFLFVALAAYLKELDYRFAAVTATDALRRAFEFFRFDPIYLGTADRAALADNGDAWGDYYARNPPVMAGAIAPCFSRLEQFLPVTRNTQLSYLLTRRGHLSKEAYA